MVTRERTELGPLYYERPLPRGNGTESAVLWPFFQWTRSDKVQEFGVRPVFNYRFADTEGIHGKIREIQALWPLFLHRETEGMAYSRTRIYPIFYRRKFEHADGEKEIDTFLLPFLLTGRDGARGRYFGLFPLGGVLKGIFGRERITFVLFPLYADTQALSFRTWNVLWPIFQYTKGERQSGFSVFPFVVWKQKDDWYKKLYILWPFFGRIQEWLNTDHPTDSWFFLPFYARQQTSYGYIHYVLYPFFSYQRSENPGNRYRGWQVPWPFLSFMRGDNYHKNFFWPFWGRSRLKGDYRKDFALYPVYWFYSYRTDVGTNTRRFVLPFYWDKHAMDAEGNLIRRRDKVWPLADYQTDTTTGDARLRILSPPWFRDPDGFERNYGDFWAWYKREIHPEQGVLDQKVLWYRWYRRIQEDRQEGAPHAGDGPGNGAQEEGAVAPGPGDPSAPEAAEWPVRRSGGGAGGLAPEESPADAWAGPGTEGARVLSPLREMGLVPEASPP